MGVAEVAAALGITARQLRHAISSRSLPAPDRWNGTSLALAGFSGAWIAEARHTITTRSA